MSIIDTTVCASCLGTGMADPSDPASTECLECEGAGQYLCRWCCEPYDREAVFGSDSCLYCAWVLKH